MAGFVLRVKTKSGQKVVNGLTPNSKVSELKSQLSTITGVPADKLQVLSGFPPKALDLSKDDQSLDDAGITSGDTFIVEEKTQVTNIQVKNEMDLPRSHIHNSDVFSHIPGILMKKIVPADNSCLFTSIGYVVNGTIYPELSILLSTIHCIFESEFIFVTGKIDPSRATCMRKIIANVIASDQDEYSESILERPNSAYCDWILKPDSWGGAIELKILSQYFGVEIDVVDCVNAIINRFGEDRGYASRVFIMFDGIHYDPLYLEPVNVSTIIDTKLQSYIQLLNFFLEKVLFK